MTLCRLAEAVTPFLHTPYSEQLETKVTSIKTYLRKVVQQIKKTNPVRINDVIMM